MSDKIQIDIFSDLITGRLCFKTLLISSLAEHPQPSLHPPADLVRNDLTTE